MSTLPVCFNCKNFTLADGTFDGGYGSCSITEKHYYLEAFCPCGRFASKFDEGGEEDGLDQSNA